MKLLHAKIYNQTGIQVTHWSCVIQLWYCGLGWNQITVCYYGNYLKLVIMLKVCSYVQLTWEFLCSENQECAEEEEQTESASHLLLMLNVMLCGW